MIDLGEVVICEVCSRRCILVCAYGRVFYRCPMCGWISDEDDEEGGDDA